MSLGLLPPVPRVEARNPHTPDLFGMYLSQRYTQIAQGIQSSIPPAYRFLCPQGTKIVGEHPIGAGLSANVWEATHDNRKVVLKSYRYDISSDVAQIIAVCCNYDLY